MPPKQVRHRFTRRKHGYIAYLFFSFLQFFQWILDQGHLLHYHSSHLYLLFSWLLYFLFFQISQISSLLFWLTVFLLGEKHTNTVRKFNLRDFHNFRRHVNVLTCWFYHLMWFSYLLCFYWSWISHRFPSSAPFWRDRLSPTFFSKANMLIQIFVQDGLFG